MVHTSMILPDKAAEEIGDAAVRAPSADQEAARYRFVPKKQNALAWCRHALGRELKIEVIVAW